MASEEYRATREDRAMLYAALDALPVPFWIKEPDERDGRMVWINNAYSLRWAVPKEKYVGARDSEVWGAELALTFARNDMAALEASPRPYFTEEPVPEVPGDPLEGAPIWQIIKQSIEWKDRSCVVGIAVFGGDAARMVAKLGAVYGAGGETR